LLTPSLSLKTSWLWPISFLADVSVWEIPAQFVTSGRAASGMLRKTPGFRLYSSAARNIATDATVGTSSAQSDVGCRHLAQVF
jgi:hypothetical protein